MKIIAKNRKAFHKFHVTERVETGISLRGSEVKSLRAGGCSMTEAYVRIIKGEAFVLGLNIPPYSCGGYSNHKPTRKRKLLMHKREIRKLHALVSERGLTLVPLKLYLSDRGLVKLEVGLAKGKKLYDKRESIRSREMDREARKAVRDAKR